MCIPFFVQALSLVIAHNVFPLSLEITCIEYKGYDTRTYFRFYNSLIGTEQLLGSNLDGFYEETTQSQSCSHRSTAPRTSPAVRNSTWPACALCGYQGCCKPPSNGSPRACTQREGFTTVGTFVVAAKAGSFNVSGAGMARCG